MRKICAVFQGKNLSLGYEKDKKYYLFISTTYGGKILINTLSGGGICPYDNIETFLENWTEIWDMGKIE